MTKKEIIVNLRDEGKSYRDITNITGFSSSLVSYYLTPGEKEKNIRRNRNRRNDMSASLRKLHGDQCCLCGYSKCLEALEFHHLIPVQKSFEIAGAIAGQCKKHFEEIVNESKKCILVCSNCHREIHANKIDTKNMITSFGYETKI